MKKLLVANWKMNGNKQFAQNFIEKMNDVHTEHDVVLCLPFPYLYIGERKNFSLGAQDCHDQEKGAYTGDVSASMLKDFGCKYVIIGHSERRLYHGETNQKVRSKAEAAISSGLIPIVCVGEKTHGDNPDNIMQQCAESICKGCIIAYEPLWAIGTGITPNVDEINQVVERLNIGYNAPVIYGGSLNPNNVVHIMRDAKISGLLIGGASLDFNAFQQIVHKLI